MSIYEKHTYPNPALPFLFHTDTVGHNVYPTKNWHENIEVLHFIDGVGKVRINAGEYEVSRGDTVVINTNCLHEFKTDGVMKYYVIIVDRAFCTSNYIDTDALHFSTKFRDSTVDAYFESLNNAYQLPQDAPWRTQTIRTLVMQMLTELCRRHSESYNRALDEDATLISAVKHAVGYIHSEYNTPLTLEKICARVGLSKYYFAREFHRISGYTIVNYINLTRCENAKLMLREGAESILEVAQSCGYGDQSYFSRIFKRYTGLSPTKYKSAVQNKEGS